MGSPSLSGSSRVSTASSGCAANRAGSISIGVRTGRSLLISRPPSTDLGQAFANLLHRSSGEKSVLEFLVLEPLRHLVDHVYGTLIGRSGALQVSLRLVQGPQGLVRLPELRRVADLPANRQRQREGCLGLLLLLQGQQGLSLQPPALDQIFAAHGRLGQLQALFGELQRLGRVPLGEPQLSQAVIKVLRVAPLHPLFAPLPALLGISVDFLQIALGLFQVAQKQVVIAEINLRVPNDFGVTDRVRGLSPLLIGLNIEKLSYGATY